MPNTVNTSILIETNDAPDSQPIINSSKRSPLLLQVGSVVVVLLVLLLPMAVFIKRNQQSQREENVQYLVTSPSPTTFVIPPSPTTTTVIPYTAQPQAYRILIKSWQGKKYYIVRQAYLFDPSRTPMSDFEEQQYQKMLEYNVNASIDLLEVNQDGTETIIAKSVGQAGSPFPNIPYVLRSSLTASALAFFTVNEFGTGGQRDQIFDVSSGKSLSVIDFVKPIDVENIAQSCSILPTNSTTQNTLVINCNSSVRKNEMIVSLNLTTQESKLVKTLSPSETFSCVKEYDNMFDYVYENNFLKIGICDLSQYTRGNEPLKPISYIYIPLE